MHVTIRVRKIPEDYHPDIEVRFITEESVYDFNHRSPAPDGFEYYFVDRKLSRTNGPAVVTDTNIEYRVDGILHRFNGPALTVKTKFVTESRWYNYGYLNRLDGPALIVQNNLLGDVIREEWIRFGKFHRIGGAAKMTSGREEWWEDGILHRVGGAAIRIETLDGVLETWIERGKVKNADVEFQNFLDEYVRDYQSLVV